jgi:hypothetical protein
MIILIAGLTLAGCGKNIKNMKYSEMKKLSDTERQELSKDLTMEEGAFLMRGAMKYVLDTNAIADKTIGELIDEGRKAAANK